MKSSLVKKKQHLELSLFNAQREIVKLKKMKISSDNLHEGTSVLNELKKCKYTQHGHELKIELEAEILKAEFKQIMQKTKKRTEINAQLKPIKTFIDSLETFNEANPGHYLNIDIDLSKLRSILYIYSKKRHSNK